MGPTFDALSDGVDAQEDHALADLGKAEQVELADLRRQVIALRRHLAPQREAMARLGETLARLFPGEHGSEVRGLVESVTRLVEELDELRDRTAVTQDLLAGQQADVMNRQMLMLSIVAAIFLPLGLLTGLLGINVGGMPGVESPWAFGVVCVVLLVVAGIQVAVMRRMRFF
jgi:zinc transporter